MWHILNYGHLGSGSYTGSLGHFGHCGYEVHPSLVVTVSIENLWHN